MARTHARTQRTPGQAPVQAPAGALQAALLDAARQTNNRAYTDMIAPQAADAGPTLGQAVPPAVQASADAARAAAAAEAADLARRLADLAAGAADARSAIEPAAEAAGAARRKADAADKAASEMVQRTGVKEDLDPAVVAVVAAEMLGAAADANASLWTRAAVMADAIGARSVRAYVGAAAKANAGAGISRQTADRAIAVYRHFNGDSAAYAAAAGVIGQTGVAHWAQAAPGLAAAGYALPDAWEAVVRAHAGEYEHLETGARAVQAALAAMHAWRKAGNEADPAAAVTEANRLAAVAAAEAAEADKAAADLAGARQAKADAADAVVDTLARLTMLPHGADLAADLTLAAAGAADLAAARASVDSIHCRLEETNVKLAKALADLADLRKVLADVKAHAGDIVGVNAAGDLVFIKTRNKGIKAADLEPKAEPKAEAAAEPKAEAAAEPKAEAAGK